MGQLVTSPKKHEKAKEHVSRVSAADSDTVPRLQDPVSVVNNTEALLRKYGKLLREKGFVPDFLLVKESPRSVSVSPQSMSFSVPNSSENLLKTLVFFSKTHEKWIFSEKTTRFVYFQRKLYFFFSQFSAKSAMCLFCALIFYSSSEKKNYKSNL